MARADGLQRPTWRRWRQAGIVAPLLAMMWLALWGGGSTVRAEPSLMDIVVSVKSATGAGPERITFRQDVELRVFIFRWNFYADVARDDGGIRVEVHGAPKFLSSDVSASLLEVSEGLDGFDLELIETSVEEGETFYVLRGTAKEGEGGAQGGTVWVNGRTWLIERAMLHYPWGTMTVDQTFQTVNGYTLLKEQVAKVDRLGATMRVQYGGYSID